METQIPVINRKYVFKTVFYTLIFDTIIAIFLTSMAFGGGFIANFIISQCIGISICSFILIALYLFNPERPAVLLVIIFVAMVTGSIIGVFLGSTIAGFNTSVLVRDGFGHVIHAVLLGLLFGSIISYFFFSRQSISYKEALIQEEKIKRLISEKKVAETNLRLLQAQIEPHFLFNTLSNILSLLDTDQTKGKSMLEDLIHYLRSSLSKTREKTSTIGHEVEMIRAYINIFKVRMGDRLRYNINVPESIKGFPFPPMLVQPLVENAIKHGLEPRIEGGEISFSAEEGGGILRLEISDTGLGFNENGEIGVGLSNVKERLQSLYGDKGRLILEENQPSGLKAIIEIPKE